MCVSDIWWEQTILHLASNHKEFLSILNYQAYHHSMNGMKLAYKYKQVYWPRSLFPTRRLLYHSLNNLCDYYFVVEHHCLFLCNKKYLSDIFTKCTHLWLQKYFNRHSDETIEPQVPVFISVQMWTQIQPVYSHIPSIVTVTSCNNKLYV